MAEEARKELAQRMKRRGLDARKVELHHKELIVKKKTEIVLGRARKSAFEPVVTRPESIDALCAQLGPSKPWMKKGGHQSAHLLMRHNLLKWAEQLPKKKRVDDDEAVRILRKADEGGANTNRMLRALSLGIVEREEVANPVLETALMAMLRNLEIFSWLFDTVVVSAGSTLRFDPPGPHVFYAYKLVIEPGGTIVSNRAPVTLDCVHLEAQ